MLFQGQAFPLEGRECAREREEKVRQLSSTVANSKMSSNVMSDNFYYTKDLLEDHSHDDFTAIDISGSPVASSRATPGSTTASDEHITKARRKKYDWKHVLIIALIVCNCVLTFISLVVAIAAIEKVHQQGKDQSMSMQILNIQQKLNKMVSITLSVPVTDIVLQ